MIDVGLAQSQLHLRVATAPCLLGYGVVGRSLYSDPATKREGNPYWPWICEYNGDDFQTAVSIGRAYLEDLVQREPPSPAKLEELTEIFRKVCCLLMIVDQPDLSPPGCAPRDWVLADGLGQVVTIAFLAFRQIE